jgi:hypothetical protein
VRHPTPACPPDDAGGFRRSLSDEADKTDKKGDTTMSQRVITIDDGDQVIELPHGVQVLDIAGGGEASDVTQIIRLDSHHDDDDDHRHHHHHH